MEKASIWKRVGSWLRRNPEPVGTGPMERVDAEGVLVEGQEEERASEADGAVLGENEGNSLTTRSRRDPQLAALEDGFGRLVDVLEAINENVVGQREETGQLQEKMGQLLAKLPDAKEQQAAWQELSGELRSQGQRQHRMAEQVSRLPEMTQQQVGKLGEIAEQLETAGQTQGRMLESFRRFDNSMEGVTNAAGVQTATLREMQTTAQRGQDQLADLLHRQNRRLTWYFVGAVVLSLAALAGVGVVAWLVLRGG